MLLEAGCRVLGDNIDNDLPMYVLVNCRLFYQMYYTVTVYIEDENAKNDGLISKPIEYFVLKHILSHPAKICPRYLCYGFSSRHKNA